MANLCIIPARGGSKRIPKKNIKDFLGKPIIAYSIDIALKSGLFDEVMVSTDDEDVAEIALKFGAKVPMLRSGKNADDFATLADVIDEVSEYYRSCNRKFDNICMILPTAPLLKIDFLNEGLKRLNENKELSSIKPIVRFNYPVQRALRLDGQSKRVEFMHPKYTLSRSQDLEPAYHDAGAFYWIRFDKGLRNEPKGGFEVPSIYVQDIDTMDDWKLAEFKYKYLYQEL